MQSIQPNYFNYNLHQRINRKSHFQGVNSRKLETLNDCTKKPEFYMQGEHLELSGRRVMDGEEVIEKTRLIRVKIHYSNGVEPYRRQRKHDAPNRYLKYPTETA